MKETVPKIGETIRHLDLFAGCGGFSRAIELTTTHIITTQFVEIDPDAQKVLKDHYHHIPIHSDARNYSPSKGEFDLITSGFQCTGTSIAGTRTGLDHEESALFREVLRVLWEGKPKFSIIEQPLGIVTSSPRRKFGCYKI